MSEPTSPAARAKSQPRKKEKGPRTSLFASEPPAPDADSPASEVPFLAGLTTASPVLSIGFELEEGELIFPWASLVNIQRLGSQAIISIGNWQFTLIYEQAKAETASWSFLELIDALMDQSVRWLRHRPNSGLTIFGKEVEDDA